MIKEVKLKKTKKIKKYGKRKNNKIGFKKSITKRNLSKSLVKHEDEKKHKKDLQKDLQKGGNKNLPAKENFEVKRLTDIDYSQFALTKYINANIDWGSVPGPPPMDCCIM